MKKEESWEIGWPAPSSWEKKIKIKFRKMLLFLFIHINTNQHPMDNISWAIMTKLWYLNNSMIKW